MSTIGSPFIMPSLLGCSLSFPLAKYFDALALECFELTRLRSELELKCLVSALLSLEASVIFGPEHLELAR